MFSSSWLWVQNQYSAVTQWAGDQLKTEDPVAEIPDIDEIFILPFKSLKKFKQTTHSQEVKTYYIFNNPRGETTLYCIDAGTNKFGRKIELSKDFIAKLAAIDPNITSQVEVATPITDVIQSGAETKLAQLTNLLDERDGIALQIVDEATFKSKKIFDKLPKDTYFLVNDEAGNYQLYYYNIANKTKAVILAYDKTTKIYDLLPELMQDAEDKTVYEGVSISEEGLEGLANRLENLLREQEAITVEDTKDIRDFINFYHEPLPTPDIYLNAKKIVVEIKKHVDTVLEKFLDPFYFEKYFKNGKKDAQGRYILPEENNNNKKMINYMVFYNMLTNMESFLRETSKLHLHMIQPFSMYEAITNSVELHENYSSWISAYNDLYYSVEPLGAMTLLRNISSEAGLMHELQKLIPFNPDKAEKQFTTNPFYLSYINQSDNWKAVIEGTENKINALQTILNDFSKNLPEHGEANANIQTTIDHINNILQEFNSNDPPRTLLEILKFVYDVHPKVIELIKTLPKSYVSLQSVFQEHLLTTAQQLNLIFRDVALNFDQFEIEYNLKSGSLMTYEFVEKTSLQSMLETFNKTVIETGYEFKPEESFPYAMAVREQREAMLTYPNTPKELLISRIKLAEQTHPILNRQHSIEQSNQADRLKQATTLINERILDLTVERSNLNVIYNAFRHPLRHIKQGLVAMHQDTIYDALTDSVNSVSQWFSLTKRKDEKIELLNTLKDSMRATQSFDDALQALSTNPIIKQNTRLLWTGRTGQLLKRIQNLHEATPKDLVIKVELEIERLKQHRNQRILLYARSKRQDIEKQILALEKLNQILARPGNTAEEALKKINATNPVEYQTLIRRNKPFIEDLTVASQRIATSVVGKKTIDFIDPSPLDFTARDVQLKRNFMTHEIDKRINQLTKELSHTFFGRGVKKNKLILLMELQKQLNFRSFPAAMENIAGNKNFRETFYLLHEGRTGLLMNNLQHSSVSSGEKSQYIELAIKKLKKMRSQEYSLFSESEQFIEDRIAALTQLKDQLNNNPDLRFDQAFENLSSAHQHLLDEYEKKLFKKLQHWEVSHQNEKDYARIFPLDSPTTPSSQPIISVATSANAPSAAKSDEAKPSGLSLSAEYAIFYEGIIANIKSLEDTTSGLFQSLLDPASYRIYFGNAPKDEQGRFIFEANALEPQRIQDYKKFYNVIANTRILYEKLNKLHTPIIEYTTTNYTNLITDFPALSSALIELTVAYQDLYHEVDEANIFTFLGNISTAAGAKEQVMAFMPPGSTAHVTDFANNPIFQAFNKHERIFFGSLNLNEKLDHIQSTLLALDDELPASEIAKESTKNTIADVLKILQETRKFANSPCQLFDTLKYIYSIRLSLESLINNSGQTLTTLNQAVMDQLLAIIKEFNLVLRDVMLAVDNIKLTNFLADSGPNELLSYEFKKGLSIDNVLSSANTWMEGLGYEFKNEERYPYHSAILEQRKTMLLENSLPKKYLLNAISSTKNKILAQDQREHKQNYNAGDALATRKQQAIITLIDKRISELDSEKRQWFSFTKTKDIKIKLLTRLKTELTHHDLDTALQLLQESTALGKNFSELTSGRTGLLLLEIGEVQSSPHTILKMVDNEITRVTRASYTVYSLRVKNELVNSINGLQKLHQLLSKQGFRIDDALAQLSAKFPEQYALLLQTQQPLLDKIQEINRHIDDYQVGKKIIGDDITPLANIDSNSEPDIMKRIEVEIAYMKLPSNAKPALFSKDVSAHVRLLETMKDKLLRDPKISIKSFLDDLKPEQRKLIKQHKKLLQDVGKWQAGQVEKVTNRLRRKS